MSEEAIHVDWKAPQARNTEALVKGLLRSWPEKVKSKLGRRHQGKWGALQDCGSAEGLMVGEKGVFGYSRWESLRF